QTNLSEIVRHLYRWFWDEADIERAAELREWVFWVRAIAPHKLDAGDQSVFAEILIPELGTSFHLKKGDYTIEQLKPRVKTVNFHVKNVAKTTTPPKKPEDCEVVKRGTEQLKEYLFRPRTEPD